MTVAILDQHKKPLPPCHPAAARKLLREQKAAVYRAFPFTLIMKTDVDPVPVPDLRLKLDPGSKTTGLAIVNQSTGEIVFAAEIGHHGQAIRDSLESRRSLRRSRRQRKTRYRQARFNNRTRPKGWLPPSLKSRIANVGTWVRRLSSIYPISGLAMELVKFDMQLMLNPEISGVEYQQGTLAGYETREYLLEKFQRTCAYCQKKDVPLQIEHVIPKARGGSNRVSNLTLACEKCNQKKGAQTAEEFGFPKIQAQAKAPLKDAAAVNASRRALFENLKQTGLPVETGSGGLTKFNRTQRDLPKAHWIDAACVGKSTPARLITADVRPLQIRSMGHGSRQMCRTDKYGFPVKYLTRNKTFMGFKTGDIVRADVPKGKAAGIHTGRVTIRQRKSFMLNGLDVSPAYMVRLHRADGYSYNLADLTRDKQKALALPAAPSSAGGRSR